MSERINICPGCKSKNIEILKIINPETKGMNCEADIRCKECGEEWDGRVTSPYHKKNKGR